MIRFFAALFLSLAPFASAVSHAHASDEPHGKSLAPSPAANGKPTAAPANNDEKDGTDKNSAGPEPEEQHEQTGGKDGTDKHEKDEKAGKGKDDKGKGEAKEEASDAVVTTVALKAATGAHLVDGVASVLSPDTIVQLDADLRVARLAAEFSKAQLARAETLFKDKITVSKQEMETAARQSATDTLQLSVLEQKLRMAVGDGAPFLKGDALKDAIPKLAKGEINLLRLDFPGISTSSIKSVKVTPLTGSTSIEIDKVWPAAQANGAVAGAAFMALAPAAQGLKQGDRARVTANAGETVSGVIVPHAAIVIAEGRAWCYVEKKPQKFVRRPISLENPVDAGYLVKSGFAEGDKVVVQGAGHLLAREAGPGDDDDDK